MRIPFLSRLLEIKECQLRIERQQLYLLRKILWNLEQIKA